MIDEVLSKIAKLEAIPLYFAESAEAVEAKLVELYNILDILEGVELAEAS